jgi:hypothetical protein
MQDVCAGGFWPTVRRAETFFGTYEPAGRGKTAETTKEEGYMFSRGVDALVPLFERIAASLHRTIDSKVKTVKDESPW